MADQTPTSFRDVSICHGQVVPKWVAEKIRCLQWDVPPDEIRICGATLLYRHDDSWSYATFTKHGRHVMGLASYISFEHAKAAAGA